MDYKQTELYIFFFFFTKQLHVVISCLLSLAQFRQKTSNNFRVVHVFPYLGFQMVSKDRNISTLAALLGELFSIVFRFS